MSRRSISREPPAFLKDFTRRRLVFDENGIRHAVAAVASILASAVAVWVATGVGVQEIAVFLGYELAYLLFPGWAVYRMLAPGDRWSRQLVFGFALGYAIQVLTFMLAGAVGSRAIVYLYPLAAIPLAVAGARGSSQRHRPERVDVRRLWATTLVAITALLWLTLAYFTAVPLPWEVPSATYTTDLAYHLSLAAEAKHHWPLQDPEVAGTGLYYHVWAHLSMAATSEVTGLSLPLVLFRLWTVPLLLLVAAGITVAARTLTGRAWAGPVAAALVFLVGEVDFESAQPAPFSGYFFTDFWLSPTFLLALALFLPTITLLAEQFRHREPVRRQLGSWFLLAVLFAACEGAKATVLPVILGALALLLILGIARRAFDRIALVAFLMAGVTFTIFYVAIYRHSSIGLRLHPLGSIEGMPRAGEFLARHGNLAWPVAVAFGALALFGPQLAGLPPLLFAERRRDPVRELLLALGIVGIGGFFLFSQFGGSQRFFSDFGLVACVFLSAEGLCLAAARCRRKMFRPALVFVLALAATLAFVAYIADQVQLWSQIHLGHALGPEASAAATLLAAFAIWQWALPNRSLLVSAAVAVPLLALSILYALQPGLELVGAEYPAFAAILILLAALAFQADGERRSQIGLLLLLGALAGGALDLPLDQAQRVTDRVRAGKPLYTVDASAVDRRLYQGLTWLRHNSSPDDVIAVNNHLVWGEGVPIPAYYDYSAFSERRVFLGGWLYSAKTWKVGGGLVVHLRAFPYPGRLRLNKAVFQIGNRTALATLKTRYHVRYLVVDRLKGPQPPPGWHLGRTAFSNPAVSIFAIG